MKSLEEIPLVENNRSRSIGGISEVKSSRSNENTIRNQRNIISNAGDGTKATDPTLDRASI